MMWGLNAMGEFGDVIWDLCEFCFGVLNLEVVGDVKCGGLLYWGRVGRGEGGKMGRG